MKTNILVNIKTTYVENGSRSILCVVAMMCLLLTIGVGNAWGATENYSYADYKGNGTVSTGSSYTMTKTSSSIGDSKFYVASNATYGQLYAGGTTTITPIGGGIITQVVLTATSSSYNGYQSSGTITASAGSVSGSGTTVTWTGTASSAFTLSHSKQIRWTSIVVTFRAKVTFNANGGSCGTSNATQSTPTSSVSLPTPTRDGYTCTGWYTASSGGTKRGSAGGSYTPSASETLYAQWEAVASSFTVTYNANGATSGSVPTDATSYSSGATVTVKGNTGSLAKTGWTFAGWNTNATGTGTDRAASSTFSISANTTLYAKWTCTVTWSVNGSTSVYSAQTITYNSSGNKVSSVPTPDPEDYCGDKFVGWTTEENVSQNNDTGLGLFTTVGDSPNITGNITFYAVFADYDD